MCVLFVDTYINIDQTSVKVNTNNKRNTNFLPVSLLSARSTSDFSTTKMPQGKNQLAAFFILTLFDCVENFFEFFKVEFCVVVGVEKTVYFLLNVG